MIEASTNTDTGGQTVALTDHVINTMARELCTLSELEIARKIQQSLLPKVVPALPGFSVSGFCLSASQVGGDFYDILPFGDDTVLLVVADVMGKGVPAALFAATLRTLIRAMTGWTHRPGELLQRMNQLMFQELSGVDMFITVQLALADLPQGRLQVASAGHCPLLVGGGQRETRGVSPEGMPLGILPEVTFAEETVSLEHSDCVLLYTDGLTEARDLHGNFFGQQRLMNWLRHRANPMQDAAVLSGILQAELKQFQGHQSPTDDLTFLILAAETPSTCVLAQPRTETIPSLVVPALASVASAPAAFLTPTS